MSLSARVGITRLDLPLKVAGPDKGFEEIEGERFGFQAWQRHLRGASAVLETLGLRQNLAQKPIVFENSLLDACIERQVFQGLTQGNQQDFVEVGKESHREERVLLQVEVMFTDDLAEARIGQ
jgi:hypothetical protein